MSHITSSLSRFLPSLNQSIFLAAVTLGAFTGGLWGGLAIGGGLALYILTWVVDKKLPHVHPTVLGFAISLLGAVAVTNLRAAFPALSWHYFWQEASIVLPIALLFSPRIYTRIENSSFFPRLAWGAFIGGVALGIEMYLNGPLLHLVKGPNTDLTEYNRGISYLVIIALPILGYLWISGKKKEAVIFGLMLLFPTSYTDSRATKAAYLLGLSVMIGASFFPRFVRHALEVTFIFLLSFPFSVTWLFLYHHNLLDHLPPSWMARVEIWDYMSYRIFDRPFWGWGMGSSHSLSFQEPHLQLYRYSTLFPASHPHDAIVQMWVELGLPGLLLGTLFSFYLLKAASRLSARLVPFALGAWTSALAVSLVAYSFWDDSLFGAFALTALTFALLERQVKEAR